MCTSFVYRKENVLIGMNFDNDGKRYRISTEDGKGFLVSVEINGNYYPSFGVSSTGLFVNNLIVDSNGEGKYKRQNDKRWVISSLVSRVMDGESSLDSLREQVEQVEIVNGPFMSTHTMIADGLGRTLVVEPGRKNIYSTGKDSDWYLMTNFPLSEYDDLVPQNPSGSGADRFETAASCFSSHDGPLTVDQGFDLLNRVRQDGPEWITVLSLVFNPVKREVSYILAESPNTILKLTLELTEPNIQGNR